MQAGRLRERVAIMTRTTMTDENGQEWYRYTTPSLAKDTVWAAVRATSQNKNGDGEQLPAGTETFDVRIRYRSDVGYATRLKWGTKYLEVMGVEDYRNLGHELRLSCELVDQ